MECRRVFHCVFLGIQQAKRPERNIKETKKEVAMSKNTKEDILRIVEEENVEFIRLQFTDLFGNLKNIAITANHLEEALNNEITFNGASVNGFADGETSEMYLHPDLDTMAIFPWRPQHGKVARLLCDVYNVDGTPFEGDPRYVLKKAIRKAAELGYTFNVGPECEFFLFQTDETAMPTTNANEQAGYFDLGPLDGGENARRDMVLTLEEMGFDVESSHHEVAPAQHEIDFRHDEALETADNVMTFKLAVKTIARRHGQHATFMPKPKHGTNGSGMHLNMWLSRNGENIFSSDTDENGLSAEGYYFIGGLLKHIKGMSAIMNPLVNSYKRLVPGFEAPVYISWSAKRRNPLVRIPVKRGKDVRVELRSPDSAANPYFAIAVALMAGLDGIENKIDPGKAMDSDPVSLSADERKSLGIEPLPNTLSEALQEMQKDEVVLEALGDYVSRVYTQAKKREWSEYTEQVSDWEVERYLNRY